MKKIFTLGLGFLFSAASFANGEHGRSDAYAHGNNNNNVTAGSNRFDHRQPAQTNQRGTFSNRNDDRFGNNDRRGGMNSRIINDNGYARNNSFADNRRREDVRYRENQYDNRREVYHNTSVYYNRISNEDFFAAQRVMDRENDNARLLYAERVVDNNDLTAEQVKTLAGFFSFDSYRLDFARYAYNKTVDRENFSIVSAAFASYDGRTQFMNFLQTCE